MVSHNEDNSVANADSPICEDFEDFEDYDNIKYWVELDEDKNILFSLKDQISVNIFETKLTPNVIEFFRKLLENLHTVNYKDSINSGTFNFLYEDTYFVIHISLEQYQTCVETWDTEQIQKLAEDILKNTMKPSIISLLI